MTPLAWRQIYADLATIFHWPPSELDELDWHDLVMFHREAIERHNAMHGDGKRKS